VVCVFRCDSSLGFWLLWLVIIVKALCEFDLLGLYGYDFLVLSGCVILFAISLFPIVFYIEDNVRFGCGGKANLKLILSKFKLKNLWMNFIFGRN